MRKTVMLLASASLFACNQPADNATSPDGAEVTAAALNYDGADYGDDEAAKLAHGERLSHVLGCRGCHTGSLEGQYFPPGDPTEFYAPNITLALPKLDDTQLESLLRTGVHPDREIWYMPAAGYQYLSDADMSALIAHLRTVEPSGEPQPYVAMPTEVVEAMAEQGFHNANKMYELAKSEAPPELGDGNLALGRHIAMTTCSECHQADLGGFEGFTPALAEVGGLYDDEAFRKLLTTGEGLEGRKLGLMALAGQAHFGYLTETERQSVIDYVHALAKASEEAGPE